MNNFTAQIQSFSVGQHVFSVMLGDGLHMSPTAPSSQPTHYFPGTVLNARTVNQEQPILTSESRDFDVFPGLEFSSLHGKYLNS